MSQDAAYIRGSLSFGSIVPYGTYTIMPSSRGIRVLSPPVKLPLSFRLVFRTPEC